MDYRDIILRKFRPWFEQHGANHKALGYGRPKSQHVRFAQFLRAFDMDGKLILDVGCGFGDFFYFCEENGADLEKYTGIEVVQEFIDSANANIKDSRCTFIIDDFIEWDSGADNKFDYVIACAALNTTFEGRDDFAKKFIHKMWHHCRRGIAFSMENVHGLPEAVENKNYDPAYWVDFVLREISHKIMFFSDYHDADFTICIAKDETK